MLPVFIFISADLQKIAADMFQMEAALFVPSGTMSNLIAGELCSYWQSLGTFFFLGQNGHKCVFDCLVMVHCKERGDEIIVGDLSHLHIYEQGGSAQVSGPHAPLRIFPHRLHSTPCVFVC